MCAIKIPEHLSIEGVCVINKQTQGTVTQVYFGANGAEFKAWITKLTNTKGWNVAGCPVGEYAARQSIKGLSKQDAVECACEYVLKGRF